jgi:Rad3-related DNA helicase
MIRATSRLHTDAHLGFLLILEPFETDNATVPNPVFHFTCLDPAIAIKPVFERFSSVVITSGTISPLDMYPKMLQFTPVVIETYSMSLTRNAFLPLVRIVRSSRPHIFTFVCRLLLEGVTKLPSAHVLKFETTRRWFGTLGVS